VGDNCTGLLIFISRVDKVEVSPVIPVGLGVQSIIDIARIDVIGKRFGYRDPDLTVQSLLSIVAIEVVGTAARIRVDLHLE
jgi:hypothetical protein